MENVFVSDMQCWTLTGENEDRGQRGRGYMMRSARATENMEHEQRAYLIDQTQQKAGMLCPYYNIRLDKELKLNWNFKGKPKSICISYTICACVTCTMQNFHMKCIQVIHLFVQCYIINRSPICVCVCVRCVLPQTYGIVFVAAGDFL